MFQFGWGLDPKSPPVATNILLVHGSFLTEGRLEQRLNRCKYDKNNYLLHGNDSTHANGPRSWEPLC